MADKKLDLSRNAEERADVNSSPKELPFPGENRLQQDYGMIRVLVFELATRQCVGLTHTVVGGKTRGYLPS
jgi:hypothetical protein